MDSERLCLCSFSPEGVVAEIDYLKTTMKSRHSARMIGSNIWSDYEEFHQLSSSKLLVDPLCFFFINQIKTYK